MEIVNGSQSLNNLRDRQTGLDPDPSGADSFTVCGCTYQLKFYFATNREIPSTETMQVIFW